MEAPHYNKPMSRFVILILLLVNFTLDLPRAYQSQIIEATECDISLEPGLLITPPLQTNAKRGKCLVFILTLHPENIIHIDRSLSFNQHINLPPPFFLS